MNAYIYISVSVVVKRHDHFCGDDLVSSASFVVCLVTNIIVVSVVKEVDCRVIRFRFGLWLWLFGSVEEVGSELAKLLSCFPTTPSTIYIHNLACLIAEPTGDL